MTLTRLIMQKLNRKLFYIGIIIFFVVYAITLMVLAKETVLWEDEIYSLHTTSQNISFAVKQSYNFEGQPPVYFILLTIWRDISGTLFFARLLSLVFTIFSGLLIYKISTEYLNDYQALIATVLFLMNPAIVYFAFEARLYSFIIFLALASLYLFHKAYLSESPKNIFVFLHAVISILGVFTQYFFVLLLLAEALALFLLFGWKKIIKYFLIHFVIAIFFTINISVIPYHVDAIRNDQIIFDFGLLKPFLRTLQNFIFSFKYVNLTLIVRRLIIVTYIIWLIISIKKLQLSFRSFYKPLYPIRFLIIISLFFYLSFVILFIGFKLDYEEKYIAILYPSLFLIFIFSFTLNQRYFVIWAFLIFIYYGYINYKEYSSYVKIHDYEQIANYVEKIEKDDEPILFYLSLNALPFQYYYKGSNKIIPLPVPVMLNTLDYLKNIHIQDKSILDTMFSKNLKSFKSFIFLSDNMNSTFEKHTNMQMVDSFMIDKFMFKLDTLFKGRSKNNSLRIRRLVRKY
jgi:4-amino-4-deoxy-L-arabinose transferase-like glycosyltransferase